MIAERGGECASFRCDVTDDADVSSVVAEVARRWGRIDVLFNNAAARARPDRSSTWTSRRGTGA